MMANNIFKPIVQEVPHRALSFSKRQVRELRQGGLHVVWRKVRAIVNSGTWLVLVIVALVVVLAVRALRPLLIVRFGKLAAGRIGHYVLDTEVYLCERDAGLHPRRTLDIFCHVRPICNSQVKKMWDRTLPNSPYVAMLEKVNRRLPGGNNHVVPMQTFDKYDQDMYMLVGRTSTHLSFNPVEEQAGLDALRELGISQGRPFVCFHARDAAYLDSTLGNTDWRYHDYRDSGIHNYVPAVEELARQGYSAIRMGARVNQALGPTSPRIIDYATKYRTDFVDVYLIAKCRFFLGDHTGLAMAAASFRRPLALVNLIPLEMAPTWGPHDLFIPKRLWLRQEGRFMTFREMFDSGAAAFNSAKNYEQVGLEPVENTGAEIAALAMEMHSRLEGTWQTTEEDQELQERFWSLFRSRKNHGPVVSRIGASFLRQHQELLNQAAAWVPH